MWEYPVSPPNFHLIALSVALHVCSTNILSFGIFKTIASRGLAFQSFLQNFLITGKHTKKKRERKKQNKEFPLFGLNFIIERDIFDKPMIVKTILINKISFIHCVNFPFKFYTLIKKRIFFHRAKKVVKFSFFCLFL